MKAILEGQLLTEKYMRGMNYYAKSLINTLIQRGKYEIALTLFDFNCERGNREKVLSHLCNTDVQIYECNTVTYRNLLYMDNPFSPGETYQSCTGAYGDVFHFLTHHVLPPDSASNTVITIHDLMACLFPEWFPNKIHRAGVMMTWNRIQLQRPFIITDSEATKNDILNKDSSFFDRIFVVPLSYQQDIVYPDSQPKLLKQYGITQPYILFISAMEIRKGTDILVQAFNILAEKHEDINLIFIGVEYEEKVLEKSLMLSRFRSRIKWLGTVDDTSRRVLYSCAEIFVLPTLYEGFGLPVLEAMACGTPVITSNTSSLPEVAGDAAILIDPTDVEQLAFEMERVLTLDSLRSKLIAKGFENCKRFSWDKTAELTEEVYKAAYENR